MHRAGCHGTAVSHDLCGLFTGCERLLSDATLACPHIHRSPTEHLGPSLSLTIPVCFSPHGLQCFLIYFISDCLTLFVMPGFLHRSNRVRQHLPPSLICTCPLFSLLSLPVSFTFSVIPFAREGENRGMDMSQPAETVTGRLGTVNI